MHPLRALGLKVFYDASGAELARDVLIPALSAAKRYDRVSAYFNLSSFISIGEGLDKLRVNGGRMRLLMGAHDVDQEMVDAALYSEAEKLVGLLRRRILTGVTKLSSELERNRIEAAAWMMRDGLLEVKCVAPYQSARSRGIFHNKRLIFVDETGDSMTATGSVNETGAGLGGNFEELTIHTSWDSPAYTKAHMDRFETVWAGLDSKLSTIPLDSAFAQEVLQALRPDSTHKPDSIRVTGMVVEALSLSPFLGVLNSSRAPLYPHQERVLRSVFSRWPIRALLADEVGLGKTYEAAAAISFALQHADVSRVVVLAPPTLLRQWQDELRSAFGLNFWRYESSTREYISADGRVARAQGGPFRGDYPELVIVSRDLARGTRRLGHAFKGAERLPDMVVLDEAHAVRKRRTATEARTSLVGRMMSDLLEDVPHALFLTATPLQIDARELYDAIQLLGVPSSFDESSFLDSLDLLSIPLDAVPELDQAATAMEMIKDIFADYGLPQTSLPETVAGLFSGNLGELSSLKIAKMAQESWVPIRDTLVRVHPAATLCVRNTRETLSRVGYKFPEREFYGVDCTPSEEVSRLLTKLEEYLNRNLGSVEAELYPDRPSALGFVRSTYRQRAASSLQAIQVSLQRRQERLQKIQAGQDPDQTVEEDALDEAFTFPSRGEVEVDEAALRRACSVELLDIEALLGMFVRIRPSVDEADPKIASALRELNRFKSRGQRVLLFSRYTDTVQSLIRRFVAESGGQYAYASYTGEGGLVSVSGYERRGDKSLVTDALSDDTVSVVFCSDAASEGLNLQAASALVNVDVPWNPARLEQRIGRIARLGQVAERVDIVNLWYPGSVEAKIYERVLSRKDIMDLALGAFPEIVSAAIKSAVLGRSPGGIDHDVISELNERREALEFTALTSLWSALATDAVTVGSAALRREISTVLDEISAGLGSVPPGWSSPTDEPLVGPRFTLNATWLNWLDAAPIRMSSRQAEYQLGVLRRGSKALMFALKQGSWVKALTSAAIPDVLRKIYLGLNPDLQQHVFVEFIEGEAMAFDNISASHWWPEPEAMVIPGVAGQADTLPQWARSESRVTFDPLPI